MEKYIIRIYNMDIDKIKSKNMKLKLKLEKYEKMLENIILEHFETIKKK